jgi:hypothetical protein
MWYTLALLTLVCVHAEKDPLHPDLVAARSLAVARDVREPGPLDREASEQTEQPFTLPCVSSEGCAEAQAGLSVNRHPHDTPADTTPGAPIILTQEDAFTRTGGAGPPEADSAPPDRTTPASATGTRAMDSTGQPHRHHQHRSPAHHARHYQRHCPLGHACHSQCPRFCGS